MERVPTFIERAAEGGEVATPTARQKGSDVRDGLPCNRNVQAPRRVRRARCSERAAVSVLTHLNATLPGARRRVRLAHGRA